MTKLLMGSNPVFSHGTTKAFSRLGVGEFVMRYGGGKFLDSVERILQALKTAPVVRELT